MSLFDRSQVAAEDLSSGFGVVELAEGWSVWVAEVLDFAALVSFAGVS